MKEAFITHRFSQSAMDTINLVNGILEEYQEMGFRLSLRQLYYQLVARGYIENTARSYKNVGNLVSTARQAGHIDWRMIEDRGRSTMGLTHWNNPGEIARAAAHSFRLDKWADQPWHFEVMVEKDALSGVLIPTCNKLDIRITANKGYSSSSTMYDIGKRLEHYCAYRHKSICILYLGDHDPSGIDMTRDVTERLVMYSRLEDDFQFGNIEVIRLALNWDQVQLWQPPENPAKETDARFKSYVEEYGDKSWELDAVEPVTLAKLVEDIVLSRRDETAWLRSTARENHQRQELLEFAAKYNEDEE